MVAFRSLTAAKHRSGFGNGSPRHCCQMQRASSRFRHCSSGTQQAVVKCSSCSREARLGISSCKHSVQWTVWGRGIKAAAVDHWRPDMHASPVLSPLFAHRRSLPPVRLRGEARQRASQAAVSDLRVGNRAVKEHKEGVVALLITPRSTEATSKCPLSSADPW